MPLAAPAPISGARALHRVLSSPVPSDAGEQRLVGAGFHRLGECRQGPARIRRDIASRTFRASWGTTTCGSRRSSAARRNWHGSTAFMGSATITTGSTAFGCSMRRCAPCWRMRTTTSRSACAGPTKTGRGAGMASIMRCWLRSRILPATTLPSSPDWRPTFATAATFAVDGRPLIVVYRPTLLPDAKATAERWRTYCRDHGIGEIFLATTQAFERTNPAYAGFDAAIEFAPNNIPQRDMRHEVELLDPAFAGQVFDYRVADRTQLPSHPAKLPLVPVGMPRLGQYGPPAGAGHRVCARLARRIPGMARAGLRLHAATLPGRRASGFHQRVE